MNDLLTRSIFSLSWRTACGLGLLLLGTLAFNSQSGQSDNAPAVRQLRFGGQKPEEIRMWRGAAVKKLFELMMGGGRPERIPLEPKVLQTNGVQGAAYHLEEVSLQSRPDRRVHAWMALPKPELGKRAAVLALHGHGGSGEEVVRGTSLYWYGRKLAEEGYVVISPDIGSHALQDKNWSLMGERVWDAMRCLDYVVTRPEVDPQRIAVCGLSLGGETTMYVAAMDERVKLACSSGWLTTVANMKQGHCPCWDFPGLEAQFDFADIFACTAPRQLILEVGEQERAPGGFPVAVAKKAFAEIQPSYQWLGVDDRLRLEIHPGGHVFVGGGFWTAMRKIQSP